MFVSLRYLNYLRHFVKFDLNLIWFELVDAHCFLFTYLNTDFTAHCDGCDSKILANTRLAGPALRQFSSSRSSFTDSHPLVFIRFQALRPND